MKTKDFGSITIKPCSTGVYIELRKDGTKHYPDHFVFTSMESLYTFLAGTIEYIPGPIKVNAHVRPTSKLPTSY